MRIRQMEEADARVHASPRTPAGNQYFYWIRKCLYQFALCILWLASYPIAAQTTTAAPQSVCLDCDGSDPPAAKVYGATYVSQSVPTSLQAGQTSSVTISFKNTGSLVWAASAVALGTTSTAWGVSRVALPGNSTSLNAIATLTFTVTAPSTAGIYTFQWQMVNENGTGWFGEPSPNVTIQVTEPPVDNAEYVSQSVPASLTTGQVATVSMQMKNTGTTTWTTGQNYRFGSSNPIDNLTWGLGRLELPGDVAPGQTVTFNFNITAPVTTGNYDLQWRMVREGVAWFGDPTTNVSVAVTAPLPADPPPTSDPSPASPPSSYSQVEEITYYDDTTHWVLGQVAQRKINGIVVESTTFDTATAQPLTQSTYGKLRQTFTYNADGTMATVKDGNNNVTTLANWKRGIPQAITYADGTTQSAGVDDNGWITSITNEMGSKTCYAYDAMGRISQITYPSETQVGACDTSHWNATVQAFESVNGSEYGLAAGHWRQTIATGNARKITYYDALWRPQLTREYDSADETGTIRFQRFAYDHEGRVTFASYPGNSDNLSAGTWTEYDALGRVTAVAQDSEQGLLVTTTEYLAGAQTRVTNPRGQQTITRYMAYDQPTIDWPVAISSPEGATTEIVRDMFGKPVTITRRNGDGSLSLTRRYVYAWDQSLCKAIEPETGATVFYNDGADNLSWSASGLDLPSTADCNFGEAQSSGRLVGRTYDARNRLLTLNFPDGRGNQTWTYTADGLPATTTTSNAPDDQERVVNAYSYNWRRLLTGESSNQPDWYIWSLGYGYDANAHLSVQTYPTGLQVDYAPNALGQPTRAGSYATGVSYYPNGAIAQFTYGNGIVHTMQPNARQLPARSTDSGVLDLGYDYDGNANVGQITDYLDGRQSRTMSYDGLDRLTLATSPMWGTASYAYDVLDNLTHVAVGASNNLAARDQAYCYDGHHHLTNVKTASCDGATVIGLGYDVQGNLSNKNGQTYGFDYGNRLREVTGQEYYRYDGQGRRVLAHNPTLGNILSMYGQNGQVLFQQDQRRNMNLEHVYLGGSLVAIRETWNGAETVKYQHTDALGSPVVVTGSNAGVLEKSEYEPYGQQSNRPLANGVGYTGHVQDAATGLTYMQQRYYDPEIGRFLSVDPVTAYSDPVRFFNRYRYASNNPYSFTDPDGRADYYNFPNGVVVVIQHYDNKSQFSNAQIEGQASKFNGPTSSGKNMVVLFRPGTGSDAVKITTNQALSDAPGSNNRSHADKINGRNVEVAPDAVGAITAGHEMGHTMGAGDQYSGGIDANGQQLSSDVPGTQGAIMRDYGGNSATQQTRNEIENNATQPGNRVLNCSSMQGSSCK